MTFSKKGKYKIQHVKGKLGVYAYIIPLDESGKPTVAENKTPYTEWEKFGDAFAIYSARLPALTRGLGKAYRRLVDFIFSKFLFV